MTAAANPADFELQIRALPRRSPKAADRAPSSPAPIQDDLSTILPSE
jgi:hypothetical protein